MEITKETILKRTDMQGVWEDETNTLKEWFEYVLNTLWLEDRISNSDYDKGLKITDLKYMLSEIASFADIYEFEFIIIKDNKEFSFDEFGNVIEL